MFEHYEYEEDYHAVGIGTLHSYDDTIEHIIDYHWLRDDDNEWGWLDYEMLKFQVKMRYSQEYNKVVSDLIEVNINRLESQMWMFPNYINHIFDFIQEEYKDEDIDTSMLKIAFVGE